MKSPHKLTPTAQPTGVRRVRRPRRSALLTLAFFCALWLGTIPVTKTAASMFATVPIAASAGFDSAVRITFADGDQTFTVPAGVTSVNVKIWGGGGGGGGTDFTLASPAFGGAGGYTTATLAVTPGENLTVIVGQGGVAASTSTTYGGGGAGGPSNTLTLIGGSGGGRSAIRRGVTELLTAGGGGGASPGAGTILGDDSTGGAGGGANGGHNGTSASGGGGTQAAGGGVGPTLPPAATKPTIGSMFQGGNGGGDGIVATEGGGGGGYYGGGGGTPQLPVPNNVLGNGSGGGGSGFIGGAGVSAAATTAGTGLTPPNQADVQYLAGIGAGANGNVNGGHGQVIIQWVSYAAPSLNVKAGGRPNNAGIGDPAICIDPSGLVGIEATVTNPNAVALASTFTATLPAGLTAIAGTCNANINPGGCTIAANGGSVTWNGMIPANTTVTIIYRARLGAGVAQGAQLCIDNNATVGGVAANLQYCFTINCPLTNTRLSDQKAGSVLVFPYYTSTIGGASDTRLTISNISNAASTVANTSYVHLFLIDGTSCQQADLYLCLTPNASFSFKASDFDPGNTGYLLAVAVNNQGVPIQNNILIGNAFVNTPTFADNYGAESFWANSFAVATVSGNTATLYFDHTGYDAVPKQFAVEIQSPVDAVGQQIVTAGLSGDLTTSAMSGAAQVGTGLAFNEKEAFGSFNQWLTGTCQARATISTISPRVPNGLGNLIRTGQAGSLKFNVGAAVGLLLTPRTGAWTGIRTLHKTQTTATTLTIPILAPVC